MLIEIVKSMVCRVRGMSILLLFLCRGFRSFDSVVVLVLPCCVQGPDLSTEKGGFSNARSGSYFCVALNGVLFGSYEFIF